MEKGFQRLRSRQRERGQHFVNTLIIELENDKMVKMQLYSVGKTTDSGKLFTYFFRYLSALGKMS